MKKVIILQHENWFVFSPSGHTNYTRYDEIKAHGFKKLIATMQLNSCEASRVDGYSVNSPMRTTEEINNLISGGENDEMVNF